MLTEIKWGELGRTTYLQVVSFGAPNRREGHGQWACWYEVTVESKDGRREECRINRGRTTTMAPRDVIELASKTGQLLR